MYYREAVPMLINDSRRAIMMLQPQLPKRVEAAMAVVQMFSNSGPSNAVLIGMGETPRENRRLTDNEAATYESALAVIRLYFTGENDYADTATLVELTRQPEGG